MDASTVRLEPRLIDPHLLFSRDEPISLCRRALGRAGYKQNLASRRSYADFASSRQT